MNKQEPTTAIEINKLHESFCKAIRKPIQIAIQLGELLTAQKEKCRYGEWTPWVKANLEFSIDTAQNYMRCYANKEKLNGHSTIDEFIKSISTPKAEAPRHLPTQNFTFPRKEYTPPDFDNAPPPEVKYPKIPADFSPFVQDLARTVLGIFRHDKPLAQKLEALQSVQPFPRLYFQELDMVIDNLRLLAKRATKYANLLETLKQPQKPQEKPVTQETRRLPQQ